MNKIGIIALVCALALGQIARVQVGSVAVTALDIIVGIISIVVLGKYLRDNKQFRGGALVKCIALFFLSGLIGLLLFSLNLSSYELGVSLLYAVRIVVYLGLYFWVKDLANQERKIGINSITWAGVFMLVVGFIQFFYYPNLRNLYYLGWDDHLYRLFSVFLDPNFAGAFFTLYVLFIVDLFRSSKESLMRTFYGCIVAAGVIAIFLTHSRTGLIMLLVGVVIYFLLYVSKKVAIVAITGFLLLLIFTSNTNIEGLNPLRSASSNARVESAQNAVKIIQNYPIFGVGFNSYRYAQIKMGFRQETSRHINHADAGTDNSYLFILATTGIAGGIFFTLFLFRIFQYARIDAQKGNFPARGYLVSLVVVMVGSLFLNIIFYPMILVWLVVQAGLIRSK